MFYILILHTGSLYLVNHNVVDAVNQMILGVHIILFYFFILKKNFRIYTYWR